ncbi:MAG TPA: hypothetical protein VFP76_01895 [Gemmatimonadota bacterium]|nr:hypothetical protein [Gemmatimonadota bacterium]
MKTKAWRGATLASLFAMLALAPVGQNPVDLEGTWRLVSRDLPDGTTVGPPDIQGLLTFADGYRNFNIYWTDIEGNPASIAVISEYELTEDTYTETNVYTMVNDATAGGLTYDLAPTSGSSPVSRAEGSLSTKLPLRDEPAVVVKADEVTATMEGVFVDRWERVR